MFPVTATTRPQFDELLAPHRHALRGYVYRLVGHPHDAEDLIQDVTLKAFERIETLRAEAAFKGWLFSIATRTCIDHLRKQKTWRPLSQSYAEQECAEDASLRQEVVDTTRDPQFAFDVHEHISFCFTCVGRSLEPMQQAAIVLREVFGFSNQEAADILDVTEPVLRHHLSAGRKHMEEAFEGLCALVNKKGVCHQCSGFRQATAEPKRGPSLPVLQGSDPWAARLEAVRAKHFEGGVSEPLHTLLFNRIRRLESNAPPCAS